MRVAGVGGGPAGLYFAISMKLRDLDTVLFPELWKVRTEL